MSYRFGTFFVGTDRVVMVPSTPIVVVFPSVPLPIGRYRGTDTEGGNPIGKGTGTKEGGLEIGVIICALALSEGLKELRIFSE